MKAMLVGIRIIVIMIIACFIAAGNNEPFRVTPFTSSGYYRYSVSGGPALTTVSVGFLRFLLFCVYQFAYVSVSLCACWFHCNLSFVFKNSLL